MSVLSEELEVYLPFDELVDIEEEKKRLQGEKQKLEAEVERASKMLSNPGFVNKAPENKIKEEKEKLEEQQKDHQDLLKALKEALKDEVKDVILSKRLVDSPVCLVSGDGVSFEMEKVIEAMPTNDKIKAERILEINPNHELFHALNQLYEQNPDDIKDYATLLYNQALLMEGFKLNNLSLIHI